VTKTTMNWKLLLSPSRLGRESETMHAQNSRSQYDADIDRILFSGAFRRLARKTQVHPMAANDHVHTRLTHSLEVGQVGKALGIGVRRLLMSRPELKNIEEIQHIPSILQAACLAHDLGNPPSGHAGEESMRYWLESNIKRVAPRLGKMWKNDLAAVEGNAQGFRMLTQTENHLFGGGLQLTYATLASFVKYPWTSKHGVKKFSVYLSEEHILKTIAEHVGLLELSTGKWARHPLAHLVEAADDICYSVIDLDDGVELGILNFAEISELFRPLFAELEWEELKKDFLLNDSFRVNLARLRGCVFDKLVNAAMEAFETGYDEIMSGKAEKDIIQAYLKPTDPRARTIEAAKTLARDKVFVDARKVELEIGSFAVFNTLLDAFCEAAVSKADFLMASTTRDKPSWKADLIMKFLGNHAPNDHNGPLAGNKWNEYQCLRRVLDFICGMTDNYATFVAKQINGSGYSGLQRP
jgi:dGTPase